MLLIDLIGRRFGRLLVTARAGSTAAGNAMWLCRCDCGEASTVRGGRLVSGYTISCGCFRDEARRTHGKRNTPEFNIWTHMKGRCLCPTNRAYEDYGGRGIGICDRWLGKAGFQNFIDDMGPRPTPQHSIDRYPDNNGNYEKDNCRWATKKEQANNRRPPKRKPKCSYWR